MDDEVTERQKCAEAMELTGSLRSTEKRKCRLRPGRRIEFQWHSGDHQQQEAHDDEHVAESVDRAEAYVKFDVLLGASCLAHLVEMLAVGEVIHHRAREPEQGMYPKERKSAEQQARHCPERPK